MRLVPLNVFKPSSNFFTKYSKAVLLLWIIFVICLLSFHFCLCHTVLSVHCSLVITFKERVDLLALLYVMLSCVFDTSPDGVLGQI